MALRPVEAADESFLRRLAARTRFGELTGAGLPPEALEALLGQQYDAQARAYRQTFPDADCDLVLVDGEPAGRLYVDRSGDAVHLIDIALLPECQGLGIGRGLIGGLIAEGRPVTLSALRGSRAESLYRRLGFAERGGDEVYAELEWRPS